MMVAARWLAFICALVAAAAPAGAACRQALALGLDVSGSVDAREYRLQTDGVAAALLNPKVVEALLGLPGAPVRLHVFEWAGRSSQRTLVPWTEITGPGDLEAIVQALRGTNRIEQDPATAIGEAILYGAAAIRQQPECWKRTLDLSGDGKSNTGPRPRDAKRDGSAADLTINGLVVGADSPTGAERRQAEIGDLWAYYRIEVIQGPDAFIEVAAGFEDFEAAMVRKLLKELQTLAVSRLETRQAGGTPRAIERQARSPCRPRTKRPARCPLPMAAQ